MEQAGRKLAGSPASNSGGSISSQGSKRRGQRGMEAAARRDRGRRRAARPRAARGGRRRPAVGTGIAVDQRLRVRVLGRSITSTAVPCSTIRPRYMTAIRSQSDQARLRSWVMKMQRQAAALAAARRAPRGSARARRRRASRPARRRSGPPARARARRRSRRAGAGRPRARAGSGRGSARVEADVGHRPPDPLVVLGLRRSPGRRSGSVTIAATRWRGLSVWYGSWKIICTRRRSSRRPALPATRSPSSADPPPAARLQAEHRARQRRLAAARLPDDAQDLARRQSSETPSRAARWPRGSEVDGEVA